MSQWEGIGVTVCPQGVRLYSYDCDSDFELEDHGNLWIHWRSKYHRSAIIRFRSEQQLENFALSILEKLSTLHESRASK
jgi:hypothetical protein